MLSCYSKCRSLRNASIDHQLRHDFPYRQQNTPYQPHLKHHAPPKILPALHSNLLPRHLTNFLHCHHHNHHNRTPSTFTPICYITCNIIAPPYSHSLHLYSLLLSTYLCTTLNPVPYPPIDRTVPSGKPYHPS